MGKIKEINIRNRTYYILDYMITLRVLIQTYQKQTKSHTKTLIFITLEDYDYVKINSVKPLYLIIGVVDGYIEEQWEINI